MTKIKKTTKKTAKKINKVTTKSYLMKRLRDCGYKIDSLPVEYYSPESSRKWSIILDMGNPSRSNTSANVIITCFHDGSLQFYDGINFIPNIKLTTDSIDVIAEFLNDRGIIGKHPFYGTQHWVDSYQTD